MPILDDLEKLKEVSRNREELLTSKVFQIVNAINTGTNDLYLLSKIVDAQTIDQILDTFAGRSLYIPKVSEYNDNLIISICYVLVKINKYSWDDAIDYLESKGVERNTLDRISLGKKISKVEKFLQAKSSEIIEELIQS
jgi:hypothetical protein